MSKAHAAPAPSRLGITIPGPPLRPLRPARDLGRCPWFTGYAVRALDRAAQTPQSLP